LVWGHLHGRSNKNSVNKWLRNWIRHLADGTILYTYSDAKQAKIEYPRGAVFVAPNALYQSRFLGRSQESHRSSIIYSGRLIEEKKVALLIRAYAEFSLKTKGTNLIIVGAGPEKDSLVDLSKDLGVENNTIFVGEVYDEDAISKIYKGAIVSVSPGYVGLSLTQSIGFGVPMIISRDEIHSPEYELIKVAKHLLFKTDDSSNLALQLNSIFEQYESVDFQMDCCLMANFVRSFYSSEMMFLGIKSAIEDLPQNTESEMQFSA